MRAMPTIFVDGQPLPEKMAFWWVLGFSYQHLRVISQFRKLNPPLLCASVCIDLDRCVAFCPARSMLICMGKYAHSRIASVDDGGADCARLHDGDGDPRSLGE
jgi:hypothetical protein